MKKIICLLLVVSTVFIPISSAFAVDTVSSYGMYYIRNARSGKYLTTDSSLNVFQSDLSYESNQRFLLMPSKVVNGTSYYVITSDMNSAYRLDIDNAVDANYQNVKLFVSNEDQSEAQNFRFITQSNSSYQIMPELSSTRVLDVENASTASGANVQLYQKRSSSDTYVGAQQWFLESAETSLLSWDLVVSKHLDWDADGTIYSDYVEDAAEIWNSYKSNVIRKDNLFRSCEVTIIDSSETGSAVAQTVSGEKVIRINTEKTANFSDNAIKNLLAHELGHALGMGHINDSSNVLYYAVNNTIVLDSKNKTSYDMAYERY